MNIDAGDAFVGAIGGDAKRTTRPGTVAGLGGFGALFDLKAAGYEDPMLVAATDGVGTKLELAQETGLHRDMTRAYLDERDLVHAELRSSPMLILPIWNMSDQPRLWRRPNPWAEAWTSLMRQRDGLVDLKLVSSLGTERALTAEDVTAFDSYSLARAAQLEGAEQVVVTVVTPGMEGGKLKASVHATLFDRQGVKESEFFRRDDVVFSSAETARSMAELAAEIESQIEYVWRDVNRISLRESGAFTLRIDASSVRQWSQQLALLESLAPVEDLKVMQLDSGGGQVRLMLSSSMRSLNYALESAGLDLDSQTTPEGTQQFVLVVRNR